MTPGAGRVSTRLDELRVATRHIAEVFGGRVALFLPDADGQLARAGLASSAWGERRERAAASRSGCHEHRQLAGRGSATLPGARALYRPAQRRARHGGRPRDRAADEPKRRQRPSSSISLETFAAQAALAIERVAARRGGPAGPPPVRDRAHPELAAQRRSPTTSRTPLATITGSASALRGAGQRRFDSAARRELAAGDPGGGRTA